MNFLSIKSLIKVSIRSVIMSMLPELLCAESYTCPVHEEIQFCVDQIEAGEIYLKPGNYFTKGVHLKSNLKLIIPTGAFIQLSDDAILNPDAKDGRVNAIFFAEGQPQKPIENVHIILDGVIDGNKVVHTSSRGGLEGINFKYVRGGSIVGNGIIQNVNGDGIDIDASTDVLLKSFTTRYHGGSGIHFGAPRPLSGSYRNIVIGITSIGNGFDRERNGFDLSWPNPWGAIFMDCVAVENYRNWAIETDGIVINSQSSAGSQRDKFEGQGTYNINGKSIDPITLISTRTRILLKRDLKKLLGIETPHYLEGLKY